MAQTDRTIREDAQWVKITRDSKAQTFTFARGDAGALKAKEVQTYTFNNIRTWADAESHAKSRMAVYQ